MNFLNYLPFRHKFLLAFLVVTLPIVGLFSLYAQGLFERIEFTQSELNGVHLLQESAQQLKGQSLSQPLRWDNTSFNHSERAGFSEALFQPKEATFASIQAWTDAVLDESSLMSEADDIPYDTLVITYKDIPAMRQLLEELGKKPNDLRSTQLRFSLQQYFQDIQGHVEFISNLENTYSPEEKARIEQNLALVAKAIQPIVPTGMNEPPLPQTIINTALESLSLLAESNELVLKNYLETRLEMLPQPLYVGFTALFVSLILCGFLLSSLEGSIRQRVQKLTKTMNAFNDGGLNQTVHFDSKDELNQLADAFNTLSLTFSGLVQHLFELIATLGASAGQLQGNMADIKQNVRLLDDSSQKAESVSLVVTQSVEKLDSFLAQVTAVSKGVQGESRVLCDQSDTMKRNIHQVFEHFTTITKGIESVSMSAQEVSGTVVESENLVQNLTRSTLLADENTKDLATDIHQCQEKTELLLDKIKSIHSVIGVLEHISGQTNLLALNASIEASLAGETGKGFMVVANEVKQLAHSSLEASDRIKHDVEEVAMLIVGINSYMCVISNAMLALQGLNNSNKECIESEQRIAHTIRSNVQALSKRLQYMMEEMQQSYQQLHSVGNLQESVVQGISSVSSKINELNHPLERASEGVRNTLDSVASLHNAKQQLVASVNSSRQQSQQVEGIVLELSQCSDSLGAVLGKYQ